MARDQGRSSSCLAIRIGHKINKIRPICGILQLALDLRDEKSLRIGDDGRLKFTRRARVVELGVLFAVAAWCVGWYLYVRSHAFDAYLVDIPLPHRMTSG